MLNYYTVARIFALIAMMTTTIASGQTGENFLFSENGKFILPASQGEALFHQCSRATPHSNKFWNPDPKDITELESALKKYLQNPKNGHPAVPLNDDFKPDSTPGFHRQYVGFIDKDERYIYGNFFPGNKMFISKEVSEPVSVCDGGPQFWGVVYRVSTKTIEEITFNGMG